MAIVLKNQFATSETDIENEAMKWLVQQYFEELTEPQSNEFLLWLNQSADHRHVYENMEKMWGQLTEGDTLTMEAIEESANELMETLHSVREPEQDFSANMEEELESFESPDSDPQLESLNVSHLPIILAILVSILLVIFSISLGQI